MFVLMLILLLLQFQKAMKTYFHKLASVWLEMKTTQITRSYCRLTSTFRSWGLFTQNSMYVTLLYLLERYMYLYGKYFIYVIFCHIRSILNNIDTTQDYVTWFHPKRGNFRVTPGCFVILYPSEKKDGQRKTKTNITWSEQSDLVLSLIILLIVVRLL